MNHVSGPRLHPDPLAQIGLQGFVDALGRGRSCSEVVTRPCLERIEALDGKLGAFQAAPKFAAQGEPG